MLPYWLARDCMFVHVLTGAYVPPPPVAFLSCLLAPFCPSQIRRRSQQAMEAEMALLRRQLAVATAASRGEAKGHGGETEGGLPSPVNMRRQTSRLPDGGVVDLSPADVRHATRRACSNGLPRAACCVGRWCRMVS